MNVEPRRLGGNGRDHMRVAMPDRRHVVIHVQILITGGIKQIHAIAAHHLYGLLVEQHRSRAEGGAARGQAFLQPGVKAEGVTIIEAVEGENLLWSTHRAGSSAYCRRYSTPKATVPRA
jgi:hypothetical protein